MLPGGLPMWSIGHYVAVPGGKTKLQCDGTGQTKCKVWNPPAGIAAPEDIEGFLGKDDTYYYFEASEESEDVVTNCQGGEIIMAIPINLFEEE